MAAIVLKPFPDSLPRPSLHHEVEGIEEVTFLSSNAPTLQQYLKAFEPKKTGLAAPKANVK
jgi:hypothetical protein